MESFAKKPMDFKFSLGKKDETESPVTEMTEPSEQTEYTSDELGSVLAEAIKSGSGDAVYEAVAKIVSHCGS